MAPLLPRSTASHGSGTYTFDEKTHAIQLKGLLLSASGFATRTTNGISLLFEQKKLLTLVKTLSKLQSYRQHYDECREQHCG